MGVVTPLTHTHDPWAYVTPHNGAKCGCLPSHRVYYNRDYNYTSTRTKTCKAWLTSTFVGPYLYFAGRRHYHCSTALSGTIMMVISWILRQRSYLINPNHPHQVLSMYFISVYCHHPNTILIQTIQIITSPERTTVILPPIRTRSCPSSNVNNASPARLEQCCARRYVQSNWVAQYGASAVSALQLIGSSCALNHGAK